MLRPDPWKKGTWQFFRITADAITEIRFYGSQMPGTGTDSPDPHPLLPAGSGIPGPGRGAPVGTGKCHLSVPLFDTGQDMRIPQF